MNIFEIDLESNAVDSYIDFVKLIKGKNDLIVLNLQRNPLMVDIETIEQFNSQLIQKAPKQVTKKSDKEIQDILELMGYTSKDALTNESKKQLSERKGGETFRQSLYLVQELGEGLSFLKNGTFYKNKRVFNKLRTMSQPHTSDHSNYSGPEIPKGKGFMVSSDNKPSLRMSANMALPHEREHGLKTGNPLIPLNKSKDAGSADDKHGLNLTPDSDNKLMKLNSS